MCRSTTWVICASRVLSVTYEVGQNLRKGGGTPGGGLMTQKTGPAARVRTVNSWSTSSVVYNATVTCTMMPLSLRQHGTLRQQFCSTSTVPGQGLALALFMGLISHEQHVGSCLQLKVVVGTRQQGTKPKTTHADYFFASVTHNVQTACTPDCVLKSLRVYSLWDPARLQC